MGSSLLNTAIKDTYEGLIKTSDTSTISGTAKYLSDGDGNDSVLSISTTSVGIGNTTPAKALDVTGSIRASEGILFGTDTAPANTLDDYEEGTFTPAVLGSTLDGSATYFDANGNYTKIGRAVHFEIYLSWTAGTGTGKLRITGLPYVINNPGVGYTFPAFTISLADITLTAGTIAGAEGIVGSQDITVVELPVGGGPRSGANYNAAGLLVISGSYFA